MTWILTLIVKPGWEGISIMSGDGISHHGHPLYACFVGNYPEQVLVTCTNTGECPECDEHQNLIGDAGPLEEPTSAL
jgi:hypothetical protein